MPKTPRITLVAMMLLGSATIANAQTTQDQTVHHPDTPAAMVAQANPMTPPAGSPGAVPAMDMSRMMTGGAGQMPRMMQMTRGMMPFDHVEGRIAFLKAELAITDAQLPQWNAFADVLRAGAKGMRESMAKMMQAGMPTTAPARAEAMVQMMTAHLDGMKTMAATGKALYAVLSDAQKKVADDLMTSSMGRM